MDRLDAETMRDLERRRRQSILLRAAVGSGVEARAADLLLLSLRLGRKVGRLEDQTMRALNVCEV